MLEQFVPQISAAHCQLITAANDVERTAAESRLEQLRKKWDESVQALKHALERSPASNPVKQRKGLIIDFDQVINQAEANINSEETDIALAEMMELQEAEAIAAFEDAANIQSDKTSSVSSEETIISQGTLENEETFIHTVCTFPGYEGHTYGELYESSKNILLCLANKVTGNELKAVLQLIRSDEALAEKAKRKGLL